MLESFGWYDPEKSLNPLPIVVSPAKRRESPTQYPPLFQGANFFF